jgi:FkbM family methyltransferase
MNEQKMSSDKQLVKQDYLNILEDNEEAALEKAKTHWLLGEWEALVALDIKVFSNYVKRDRFAILVASAYQNLAKHSDAKKYTRLALDWGCPQHLVARVLIADVHNTLGRMSALKRDDKRISLHFQAAVNIENNQSSRISRSRSVKKMTRLGLLSQAAKSLNDELSQLSAIENIATRPSKQQAKIKTFQTELELLHHELSLAQKRHQLSLTKKNLNDFEIGSSEWKAALENYSVSQLGQDIWVLEKTNYKQGGFFVEFGATDGVLLSNSFLLEKEFDWQGICAEPNPKFFEQLKNNRQCTVSSGCIGAKTGEQVEFVLADAYGGMLKHAEMDKHTAKRLHYADLKDNVVMLDTISLHDFLVQHNAPKKIDYLSIDTEGSEYEILKAFPFEEWDVQLITVEHNFTEQRELIYQLLTDNGYTRIEKQWDDWYFKKYGYTVNEINTLDIGDLKQVLVCPPIIELEAINICNAKCYLMFI